MMHRGAGGKVTRALAAHRPEIQMITVNDTLARHTAALHHVADAERKDLEEEGACIAHTRGMTWKKK